jgi:hypothetical protein
MPVGMILIELLLESNIFSKSMLLYYKSLSILRRETVATDGALFVFTQFRAESYGEVAELNR